MNTITKIGAAYLICLAFSSTAMAIDPGKYVLVLTKDIEKPSPSPGLVLNIGKDGTVNEILGTDPEYDYSAEVQTGNYRQWESVTVVIRMVSKTDPTDKQAIFLAGTNSMMDRRGKCPGYSGGALFGIDGSWIHGYFILSRLVEKKSEMTDGEGPNKSRLDNPLPRPGSETEP